MGMSISMHMAPLQELRVEQRLTLAQRLQVQALTLSVRLALLDELHGERYDIQNKCPSCERFIEPIEILRGFRRDPNDFTTVCPGCKERFQPRLICRFRNGGYAELAFFCPSQTTHQISALGSRTPQEILKQVPALYRSALLHFGSLRSAFKTINIDYSFGETAEDWMGKVELFLGRLPDTVIAEAVNVSVGKIRTLRRNMNVRRYSAKRMLEEVE